jgi:hypothetical protein
MDSSDVPLISDMSPCNQRTQVAVRDVRIGLLAMDTIHHTGCWLEGSRYGKTRERYSCVIAS